MKGKHCCGFCERSVIPGEVEPQRRGGLPICEGCETEFTNIFSGRGLTEINNLPRVKPVTAFNFLERG